jgi:hypothetical protein
VIYRSAVPKPRDAKKEPITVVLPPQSCKEVECASNVTDTVLASPSTPSDEYLRSVMGLKPLIGQGTFIVGFNIC